MPSGDAQVALMKSVYERSGLDPKEAGYIEAHGTGTKGASTSLLGACFSYWHCGLWKRSGIPRYFPGNIVLTESLNSGRSH